MKLLHTSDWHIGRKIEDKSMNETFECFAEWLISLIKNQNIDVLVVAGDIFDSPFPNNSSLSLYYKTLYNLCKTNLRHIIITGGNHDSVSTLNAPKELLNVMNISVIGGVTDNIDDLIVKIDNQQNQTEMIVCAVPFLREKDIRFSISGFDYDQKIEQVAKGVENFYKEIAQKVDVYKQKQIPVVVTGHLFISDLEDMDNDEKETYMVGNLQQIRKSQIPEFYDYLALGHIHKPYKIGKSENARYCGSPIHLSFDETKNKKQVVIVNLLNGNCNIKIEYIPVFRNLIQIKGTFVEILEKIKNYSDNSDLKAWASVEIIEEKFDPEMQFKIEKLRESAKEIEIIKLKYNFLQMQEDIEKKFKKNISIKDIEPSQLFDKILENVEHEKHIELKTTFTELIENYLYEDENEFSL